VKHPQTTWDLDFPSASDIQHQQVSIMFWPN